MAYHLNIVAKDESGSPFRLEDIFSTLKKADAEASIMETHCTIKEFNVPNLALGKIYFFDGLIWSIFESIEQQKKLIEFFEPMGLSIVGEEQEIYSLDQNGSVQSTDKLKFTPTRLVSLNRFLKQHSLSIFIILAIVILAVFIG